MAVVTSDDVLGQALKAAIADPAGAFHKSCLTATASITTAALEKADYTPEVDALMGATAKDGTPTQCLFLATNVKVAAPLLRALVAREASTPSRTAYSAFIGSGTLNDPTFYGEAKSAIAGKPSLAEGFYGIDADGNPDRVQLLDLEALWAAYLPTQTVIDPKTVLDSNLAPYAEAMIILQLAFELAGAAEDPVAIRDALLEVTGHDDGDQIYGPGNVSDAIRAIRAAREDGRRAKIDYQGSYSNFDFQPDGFIGTGTMVWRVLNGTISRVIAFKEEQVAAAGAAPQKDCSAPTP
jgi:hypothetical protein